MKRKFSIRDFRKCWYVSFQEIPENITLSTLGRRNLKTPQSWHFSSEVWTKTKRFWLNVKPFKMFIVFDRNTKRQHEFLKNSQ